MAYNVSLQGVEEFIKGLTNMQLSFQKNIPGELKLAADAVEKMMKQEAPKVTGSLSSSISSSFSAKGGGEPIYEAEVGPVDRRFGGSGAGAAIEEGRGTGKTPPPWFPLYARYGFSKSIAKRVARSIGREGTRPNPFVKRTRGRAEDTLNKYGIQVIQMAMKAYK